MDNTHKETKQERREKKLQKKQEKIAQHGKGLVRIYKEAILKRINKLRKGKKKEKRG